MKKYIFFVAIIFSLYSCDKYRNGVWEYRTGQLNEYTEFDKYNCYSDEDAFTLESDFAKFSEDKTCADLGYTIFVPESNWYISEEGSNTPGKYGYWGDKAGNIGGTCSLDDYVGPTIDVQSASFCQSAYVYDCEGNAEGVQSTCATYKQFQEITPGLPNCPYCN